MRSLLSGRGGLALLALFVVTVIVPGAAIGQPAPGGPPSGEEELIGQLRDEGAKVLRHSETGQVRFIGTPAGNPIDRPAGLTAGAPPESAARTLLEEYGPLFGIEDHASELRLEDETELAKGRSVSEFRQVHRDVPVLGGELNVQVDGSNNLLVATGEALPGLDVEVEPEVAPGAAQDAAIAKVAKDRDEDAQALRATEPELWIYDPALLGGPGPRVARLVWRMDITPAAGTVDFKELVLVDAKTGSVALDFNQIHTARDRRTYTMNNSANEDDLPGTPVCDESNPSCSGGDADAVNAHKFAGEVYDFYSANHGRDSLDGAGMSLISSVHFGKNFKNAFWNGQQMMHGDGFPVDDVVGHELTHGVTDFESDLFYITSRARSTSPSPTCGASSWTSPTPPAAIPPPRAGRSAKTCRA